MSNVIRKALLTGLLALGLTILGLGFAGRASAADPTVSPTFSGSGSNTDILSAIAVCDECAPDLFFTDPTGFINTWGFGISGLVQAKASWTNPSAVDAAYSAGDVRHGRRST